MKKKKGEELPSMSRNKTKSNCARLLEFGRTTKIK
jgi:hypothetical protein